MEEMADKEVKGLNSEQVHTLAGLKSNMSTSYNKSNNNLNNTSDFW